EGGVPVNDVIHSFYVRKSAIFARSMLALLPAVFIACGSDAAEGAADREQTGATELAQCRGAGCATPRGTKQVASGRTHVCAVSYAGQVWCRGFNDREQLGYPCLAKMNCGEDSIFDESGAVVAELSGAEEVAVGEEHTCARFSDGTLKCWGSNTHWQLGI